MQYSLNSQERKLLSLYKNFFDQNKQSQDNFIKNPKDAFDLLYPMSWSSQEKLGALYLTENNRVLKNKILSVGSLNTVICHPTQILKPAIQLSSLKVILYHNHPSQNPVFSEEDIKFTHNIMEACKTIGIELLDHILITKKSYTSWKSLME